MASVCLATPMRRGGKEEEAKETFGEWIWKSLYSWLTSFLWCAEERRSQQADRLWWSYQFFFSKQSNTSASAYTTYTRYTIRMTPRGPHDCMTAEDRTISISVVEQSRCARTANVWGYTFMSDPCSWATPSVALHIVKYAVFYLCFSLSLSLPTVPLGGHVRMMRTELIRRRRCHSHGAR